MNTRRNGFSLLEAMIVLVLTSIVMLAVLGSVLSAGDTSSELAVENALIANGDRALAVFENDVRNTALDPSASLAVTSSYSITFRTCIGFNTTTNTATYGAPVTYTFSPVPAAWQTQDGVPLEYGLQRSYNGESLATAPWIMRGLTFTKNGALLQGWGFGLVNGNAVTLTFYVAHTVFISRTGKKDLRYRAVSRTYKINP